ncbi:phosphoribosylanthranilate isomerase [Candidatus Marithrix sp. Canyon 246]|uniref:phosphoribosylanthranilate isomerase n=1 Tax=Candidatus Marithrix sp. Canyon 246 TaxID=1827136 RepID=UPI000849F0CE|nr:phosphoribosylanthranilate isomerase [Candidatus Marithrix sp. Canyon 246]
MTRTRVKICGITRAEDGIVAAKYGVDAIGLVFYEKSPRAVNIEQAQTIIQSLPAFVTVVGLFVNAEANMVNNILEKVPIDLLQFHGEESPEYCNSFNKPYMKALRMRPNIELETVIAKYQTAKAILLDSYVQGVKGGTGTIFDWQQVPSNLSKPIIVAGGLTTTNVNAAIKALNPYAVDVSGGVESAKGIKDSDKIAEFMQRLILLGK